MPGVVLGVLSELRRGWSRLSPEQSVLFRPEKDPVPLSLLDAASRPSPARLAVEFRVPPPGGAGGHGLWPGRGPTAPPPPAVL